MMHWRRYIYQHLWYHNTINSIVCVDEEYAWNKGKCVGNTDTVGNVDTVPNYHRNIPTIFIVVLLFPVLPMPSLTLQVCTPASRAVKKFCDIELEEELEAKQLLQVEDQL